MPSDIFNGTWIAHNTVNLSMADHKQVIRSKSFNSFLDEMMRLYNVSRDELLRAQDAFGEFKGKIWAHCIIQNWLKKKGLPVEDAKFSMVNRWFPS